MAAIARWLVSRRSRPLTLRGGSEGRAAVLCIRVRVHKNNKISVGRRHTESIVRLTTGGRPGLFARTSWGGPVAGTSHPLAPLDEEVRRVAVVFTARHGGVSLLYGRRVPRRPRQVGKELGAIRPVLDRLEAEKLHAG